MSMDRLLEACPAVEAKEAPPLPVAGFDHRLGRVKEEA